MQELSLDRLNQLLKLVSYKDWHFDLIEEWGHLSLRINCRNTDALKEYRLLEMVNLTVTHSMHIEYFSTDDSFLYWVYECIHRQEKHELDEFFKINNVTVFYPHATKGSIKEVLKNAIL